MSHHRIARATPRADFTVDIEWADGTRSVADFNPEIAKGGILAELGEPAIFLRRLYLHAGGDSLGWEILGQFIDFHADNLWRDSRARARAAE